MSESPERVFANSPGSDSFASAEEDSESFDFGRSVTLVPISRREMTLTEADLEAVADRAAKKAVANSTTEMAGLVQEKLVPVVDELRKISEDNKKMAERQNELEQRQTTQEGKISSISLALRNEIIDRRSEWYDRAVQDLFALENRVIVALDVGSTAKNVLSKEAIRDLLKRRLEKRALDSVTIAPLGKTLFRITALPLDASEGRHTAALIRQLGREFKECFGAYLRRDIPRSLRPLRSTMNHIKALLKKDKVAGSEHLQNAHGLLLFKRLIPQPDGQPAKFVVIPLFPEYMVHPSFEVLPFVDLLKAQLPAVTTLDEGSLSDLQRKNGILFTQAANSLALLMAGPRKGEPVSSGGSVEMEF